MTTYCHNYGERIGCLGTPDPRYTMDFTDTVPGEYVYWCAFCGPDEHRMKEMLEKILSTPEGLAHAEKLIKEQEEENRKRSH